MSVTYSRSANKTMEVAGKKVAYFTIDQNNIDVETVQSFGEEWTKFAAFTEQEIKNVGDEYFDIVTEKHLNKDSLVLDVGCGTGRWTKYVSQRAKFVEAIDPSDAVLSAAYLLKDVPNVRITQTDAESLPFPDESFDLVFSLGVLHHIPDTQRAMVNCVKKVKKNGYFLVYLYYSLDNRGFVYQSIFKFSNIIRGAIAHLPSSIKKFVCDIIAFTVYVPLVAISTFLNSIGLKSFSDKLPLSYYRGKSLNVIRNDSLDRFGTPLEHRFSRQQIKEMMEKSGLTEIVFSENTPFWHAIGKKP
jgi:ubiquinone/menaquinone biosynthesis C-methylase UbiE